MGALYDRAMGLDLLRNLGKIVDLSARNTQAGGVVANDCLVAAARDIHRSRAAVNNHRSGAASRSMWRGKSRRSVQHMR
jgi:hypothetical protein